MGSLSQLSSSSMAFIGSLENIRKGERKQRMSRFIAFIRAKGQPEEMLKTDLTCDPYVPLDSNKASHHHYPPFAVFSKRRGSVDFQS